MPLCMRAPLKPWIEHPIDGHKMAMEKIRQIDPTKALWRVHSTYKPPTQADFEEFYKVPYATVLGDGVVADYVLPIKWTGEPSLIVPACCTPTTTAVCSPRVIRHWTQ